MNKEILSKLMNLNNKEANKYLADFAIQIKNTISKSKDNDKIDEQLGLLKEFIYKAPDTAIEIVDLIIKNPKPNKTKIKKTRFGNFKGKNHDELILKCIELLSNICYLKIKEVFDRLVYIYYNTDKSNQNKVQEAIKKQIEYNLNVLRKMGYHTQKIIFDAILKWSDKEKQSNFDIIQLCAKEILNADVEGAEMKDYQTMVFKRSAVDPTEFLQKIRQQVIHLIFNLYHQEKEINKKIDFLETLNHASQTPIHSLCSDKLTKMVISNTEYLVQEYSKILYPKPNKLINKYPIIQAIEKQLVWFIRRFDKKEEKIKGADKLVEKIRSNEGYKIYRLFIGDAFEIESDSEKWSQAEAGRKKEIDKLFVEKSKDEWIKIIESIAEYSDNIEEWKAQNFYNFLQNKVAGENPKFADRILTKAFKENNVIAKRHTGKFLYGFRQFNHITLWDKYAAKIIKTKNKKRIAPIFGSILMIDKAKVKELARAKDITLLEEAVKQHKRFDFLKKQKKDNKGFDLNFHLRIVQALLRIYVKSPNKIENLTTTEFKNNVTQEYLHNFLGELQFADQDNRGTLDINKWSDKGKEFILDKLVEIESLGFSEESLMLKMADKNYEDVMNVFWERIKKANEEMRKKKNKDLIRDNRYDAVPSHINGALTEFLSKHKGYKKVVKKWINDFTPKSSISGWELGELLNNLGGPYREVYIELIETDKKENLKKVIALFGVMHSPDFELCLKIIEKTNDEEIWKDVSMAMYQMGVVSGEYGIADGYKSKLNQLKEFEVKYKNNSQVMKFINQLKSSLEASIKAETQRADEDIALRKLEFEN